MNAWPEVTTEQIVARLRMIVAEPEKWCETDRHFVEDAADEIERLRARIAELERFAGELDASGRKNTEPAALRGTPSDGEASASEGYLHTGASVQMEKAEG